MQKDSRTRIIYNPVSIAWADNGAKKIQNLETLVDSTIPGPCILSPGQGDNPPGFTLDFGQELNGGVAIEVVGTTPDLHAKVRVRFGESLSETMAQPNLDHAFHELTLDFPCWCIEEVGNTGFRFVRIDLLDPKNQISIKSIRGIGLERNMHQLGSFESSDPELNKIWQVGARTTKLCCQEYILDGIKRDRMAWIGDVHPQIHVIGSVFGNHEIVDETFRELANTYAPEQWMNRISSYSLWWIISLLDWYYYTGDLGRLSQYKEYLTRQVEFLCKHIDPNGKEKLGGNRFIDWASRDSDEGVDAGLQVLFVMAMNSAAKIFKIFNDSTIANKCSQAATLLSRVQPDSFINKQVNALKILTGQESQWLSLFAEGSISPWYAFYALEAGAITGNTAECLEFIKAYWGGMINLGATTFWEHFDLRWLKDDPTGIDQHREEGRPDIHVDFGEHCYQSIRHSLCHGWSSGPTAWLMKHVLGIHCQEPGFKKIKIAPQLGNLKWAKGTFPTPLGLIHVRHENKSGKIHTEYECSNKIQVTEQIANLKEELLPTT